MKGPSQTNLDDEATEQARLNHAAGVLHKFAAEFCRGKTLTQGVIDELRRWTELHIRECRQQGVPFPDMAIVPLGAPVSAIEIVRADWERGDVERWMVGLPAKYPNITGEVMARAVRDAFPDYERAVLADRRRLS